MGPKPSIYVQRDLADEVAEQVVSTGGAYAVLYEGRPVGIRTGGGLKQAWRCQPTLHHTAAHGRD